ncbi:MAG: integrase arm-type DNA-binding domain-containing protein [Methylococcus sp.]|nr:integrase arm-type DNA-binding domain-containing protein [Methylococcus sp.]
MALTDTAVRLAKPGDKPIRKTDEKGLVLHIMPNGGKWWRFRYRYEGKPKMLSLGTYPEVTLKDAREKRDEARKLLGQSIDPSDHKKAAKRTESGEDSFEHIAREWHARHMANKSENHARKVMDRLEKDVFPWIGGKAARDIAAPELLAMLRRIESRGAIELCHVTKQICGQVFRYAIATGRAERDPAADLKGALQVVKSEHFAAITEPKAIGQLLRDIEGYTGHFATQCALKLSPLVMLRPGEVRQAEWAEIDIDAAEWRIPATKMKMRDEHIIPLSKQAIEVLEAIRPLTGRGRYVFPSARTAPGVRDERPMSENTVVAALRRLGYTGNDMTAHGFRSMASTRLNESHLFHADAIERQLAHGERNQVRAAYNRAEHLPERRKMMQWWADYLDGLRAGAEVIPIRQARA